MGLDSGMIYRYECRKDKNLKEMKELPEITVHNANCRVMGISVDSKLNNMYSISESGFLVVTDLNDTKTVGGKFIST